MVIKHAKRVDGAVGSENTSLWNEFGIEARHAKGCNLGTGLPDFPLHPYLKEQLIAAVDVPSFSRYPRYEGHARLVEEISRTYSPLVGKHIDPLKEVIVTIGAYQALNMTFQSFTEEGDEVIVFEPSFDAYRGMAGVAGCKIISVPLNVDEDKWMLDEDLLRRSVNENTKMIIVNTPMNPTSKVFTRGELALIAELSNKYDCLVLADEVYEYSVFPEHQHHRISSFPGMWERTVTVCSAGKQFGVTGWRVGWAYGPSYLIEKLHYLMLIDGAGVPTILQDVIAAMMERERKLTGTPDSFFQYSNSIFHNNYLRLKSEFTNAGMPCMISDSGYFLVTDYSQREFEFQKEPEFINSESGYDLKMVRAFRHNFGMVTFPLTFFCPAFLRKSFQKYLRVSICKQPSTIDRAVQIIRSFR